MTTTGDMGTILSIWAHPDDETYLAGGIMAAARANGQRVVCAAATAGEHGTADPDTWPPARLGRVRRWEAAAAMAVLGVDEHSVHDLPDGALPDHDQAGLAWAAGLIDDVGPDTILTFGPDGITGHADHVAVHRWVTQAWRERGCSGSLLYAAVTTEHLGRFGGMYEELGVYMTGERPAGVARAHLAVGVCLEGAELDRKQAALRAMATQTGNLLAVVDDEVYRDLIAEEGFAAAEPGR